MAARERVEYDVIGKDVGGSKVFRDVGNEADKAGDKIKGAGEKAADAGDKLKDTGDKASGAGDKLKDSGDKAKESGEKYRGLAHDIEQVEGNVRRLAAEIDKTGNKDLIKDLDKQKRELRKLTRVKDLLPDDDDTRNEGRRFGAKLGKATAEGMAGAGETIANVFGKSLSGLPPQAQAAIGAGIVTAVTAAGTLVAGAVSGAVVGGLGAGGIVGGVAIAAKHPQVQAAAKLTGEEFSSALEDAAVSFVPATVESLSIVRSRIGDIGEELERAFSASSTMLPGLTEHVLAGAERAVEGFANAVERSGPAVDAIGNIIERVGSVAADTFEGLAEHADAGAHALTMLWAVFEFGIRSIAGTIEGLTAAYGWFEKIGAVVTGDTATLGRLAAEQELTKQSSGGLSDSLQNLINGFTQTGEKAAAAAVEVETFNDMVRRLANENLTAEQANLRLEEAIDRAAEAAKRNGDGIDANVPKQRENRKALLDIAHAANASAEAILTQTGSQDLAAAATERGRAKFLQTAHAMGVEAGEAQRLADQLFGIPKQVNSKINVTANTQPALDSARSVVARINNMHARISVSARGTTSFGGSAHTGEGYSTGHADGGRVFGPGTDTSDSIVTRVSRDEYVLRAAAARAIGYDTLDQLNQADRRPVAARAGSASVATPAGGGGELLAELRGLRRDLANTPLVRLDSGRTADIYARGG